MSETSTLLLVGVGGAGTAIAREVRAAFGDGMRHVLVDTDATSGRAGEPFVLLGGNRLSGHGSGGDLVAARTAAEDSSDELDAHLEGVRLAVVVTCLGGGTGSGATIEVVRHLAERGIPSLVFATTPFAFEGDERMHNARSVQGMIADAAGSAFFLPLDRLVGGTDVLEEAMRRAVATLAHGITLFWRMVEKPGYIRLDAERVRHLVQNAGRGRFATAEAEGPERAQQVVRDLVASKLLAAGSAPVSAILCGILAGDDLRLSEIGTVSEGLRDAFGTRCGFSLSTVNDECAFGGRLVVVALMFEPGGDQSAATGRRASRAVSNAAAAGRGRFTNVEPTMWHGEDLDTPTFVRLNMTLDF